MLLPTWWPNQDPLLGKALLLWIPGYSGMLLDSSLFSLLIPLGLLSTSGPDATWPSYEYTVKTLCCLSHAVTSVWLEAASVMQPQPFSCTLTWTWCFLAHVSITRPHFLSAVITSITPTPSLLLFLFPFLCPNVLEAKFTHLWFLLDLTLHLTLLCLAQPSPPDVLLITAAPMAHLCLFSEPQTASFKWASSNLCPSLSQGSAWWI